MLINGLGVQFVCRYRVFAFLLFCWFVEVYMFVVMNGGFYVDSYGSWWGLMSVYDWDRECLWRRNCVIYVCTNAVSYMCLTLWYSCVPICIYFSNIVVHNSQSPNNKGSIPTHSVSENQTATKLSALTRILIHHRTINRKKKRSVHF